MRSSEHENGTGSVPEQPGEAQPLGAPKKRGQGRRALIGTSLAGLSAALLGVGNAQADGDGPLSSATISFGAWMLMPPQLVDRHPLTDPIPLTHHGMCPTEVKVRAG